MSIYDTHPNQIDQAHDAHAEDPRTDWITAGLDAYDPYRELDEIKVARVMEGREFQSTDPRSCNLDDLNAHGFAKLAVGDEVFWAEDCGDIDGVASMSGCSGFVIATPPNCPADHVVVEDIGGEWKLIDRWADCIAKVAR